MDQALKLRDAGWTLREIGNKFNITDTTIISRFKEYENEIKKI